MNLSALRVRMFTSLCEIKQVFGEPKFLTKPRGFLKRCKEQHASVGAAAPCLRVLLNHAMKRFIARGKREEGAAYPTTALQDMPR